MASIFEFFARVLGYVLNWLYLLTNNYGLAILLLTILIALVMIPVDIKNRRINKQSHCFLLYRMVYWCQEVKAWTIG